MTNSIAAPLDSLDPTDWWMYCDLLQDSGGSERRWSFARRVAESLRQGPSLVLVLRCGANALEKHWLRVGHTWFIPTHITNISNYRTGLAWWRADWVRRGMARYPYAREVYRERDEAKLIEAALGTPWQHSHPEFGRFTDVWGLEVLKKEFFRGHGLKRPPTGWM